jgi:hypothetical protein
MLRVLQFGALFLGLAFFLALAGLAYYSSSPSTPGEQQTTTHTAEKKPQEKEHSFRGFINFLFPDAISIFTFWLVVATVVLGIIAYVQIDFLRRAEVISAQSAQAAKQSADAAKAAVELSDRTAARQLRAYVYVKLTTVRYPPNKPDRIGVGFEITNSGQTWARNLILRTAIIPREFKIEYDPWDRARWNESPPMMLGPGQSMGLQLTNVWLSDIPAIVSGDKGFDFAVWVTSDEPSCLNGSMPIVTAALVLLICQHTIAQTATADSDRLTHRRGDLLKRAFSSAVSLCHSRPLRDGAH